MSDFIIGVVKLSSWTQLPGDIEKEVAKETEEVRRAWSIINPIVGLYIHYKDFPFSRWDEFIPNIGRSTLAWQERIGLSQGPVFLGGFRKSSLREILVAGNQESNMKTN